MTVLGAAQKLGGFLDRAAGFDRGLKVIDIHPGPVRAVVNPSHVALQIPPAPMGVKSGL